MIKQTLLKYFGVIYSVKGLAFFFSMTELTVFNLVRNYVQCFLKTLFVICTHTSNLLKAYSVSDLVLPLHTNIGENLMNKVQVFGAIS